MHRGWLLLVLVEFTSACAQPARPSLLTQSIAPAYQWHRPAQSPTADRRRLVLANARSMVNGQLLTAGGLRFDADPVGFVRAAFWGAEIDLLDPVVAADPLAHGMELLYRSAARRGRLHRELPVPGDLVFWDTAPRGNALYPGQVAIVEELTAEGTVVAIGFFADGPARTRMNLRQPDTTVTNEGVRLNDQSAGNPPATLAQLFRNFADPFGG